jgi:pyruvate,water dikinase
MAEEAFIHTFADIRTWTPHQIRKAFGGKALVTDEGGILCHAAIVAREISLSCIVGTGMATEVLKNGMRIQVDLDRGEIAIMS